MNKNRLLKYSIYLFLLLFISCSTSEKKVVKIKNRMEEFVKIKNELDDLFNKKEYEKERRLAERFIKLSKQLYGKDHISTAFGYYRLGRVNLVFSKHKAKKNLLKSLNILNKLNKKTVAINSIKISNYLYLIELCEKEKCNYELNYLTKILKIFDPDNFSRKERILIYKRAAYIFSKYNFLEKAIDYNFKILYEEVKSKPINKDKLIRPHLNIANLSLALKQYRVAKKAALQAIELIGDRKELHRDDYIYSLSHLSKAESFLKNNKDSVKYAENAVVEYEKKEKPDNVIYTKYLRHLMIAYVNNQQLDKAYILANKILKISKNNDAYYGYIGDAFYILGKYMRDKKEYKKSISHFKSAHQFYLKKLSSNYISFTQIVAELYYTEQLFKVKKNNDFPKESINLLFKDLGYEKKIMISVYEELKNIFTVKNDKENLAWANSELEKIN